MRIQTARRSLFLSIFVWANVVLIASAQTKEIDIPLSRNGGSNVPFDYSELIESVRYIRIQGNALLGHIKDVKLVGDRFYIHDQARQGIHIVDTNGRILRTIDSRGRAGNEYISLTAFDVDPKTGEVHIFDQLGRRIQIYSASGQFLRSVALGADLASARDFAVTVRGTYLFFKPDSGRKYRGLTEIDSKGKVIRSLFSIDKRFLLYTMLDPPIYFGRLRDGSNTLMGHIDKNLFYRIGLDGALSIPYHLKLGISIPKELQRKDPIEAEDAMEDNFNTTFRYQETDRWLIVAEQYHLRAKFCFYDKKKGVSHVVAGTKDIIDPFETGLLYFWRSDGENLYTYLEDETAPAYRRAVREVGEGENPILVLIRATR